MFMQNERGVRTNLNKNYFFWQNLIYYTEDCVVIVRYVRYTRHSLMGGYRRNSFSFLIMFLLA